MNILIVCSGNICRSPMAAGLLKKLAHDKGRDDIAVTSAGTLCIEGYPPSELAEVLMSRHGMDISGHVSSSLTIHRIEEADVILVMEKAHVSAIVGLAGPEVMGKVHLLSQWAPKPFHDEEIFDPYGSVMPAYETCFKLLQICCEGVADEFFTSAK